jgi:hypothetical protein
VLATVIAPLIQQDEEICRREEKGGYIFVTAKKEGRRKIAADVFPWLKTFRC